MSQFRAKSQSFLSQTGPISSTALFTPDEDGDFLVALYMESSGALGAVTPFLSWTDDEGSQGTSLGTAVICIHAKAGNAISFYTTGTPAQAFNAFVTVIGL